MATNDNPTQSDENPAEQAITVQPSSITAYPGAGDWTAAGGSEPAPEGIGGLAVLHALRRHALVALAVGLACAAVTGTALWMVWKPTYKAEALLELKPSQPVVVSRTADQSQAMNEFEIFRETQQSLLKSRFVINAALRDVKLKNRPCIIREDLAHNAIPWVTEQIHVDFASKMAGIMQVSATLPDAQDAAALVNAVVEAYMKEVVDYDRQQRRDRLSDLQQIAAEKDNEVRGKRELLKRELENTSAGDEQTMATRTQLAVQMYGEFMRQFQGMRAEHQALLGKIREAKTALADLKEAEIPESEVVMILNVNPMYRDLQTRLTMLQQFRRLHERTIAPGTKLTPGFDRTNAEYEATQGQLEKLHSDTKEMVRDSKRIALNQEIRRLETQELVSTERLVAFEKEVQRKGDEAESVGKSTVNVQMAHADVDNIERILHNVNEEKERLRVELSAPRRVNVLGDKTAPAAVPETEARDFRYMFIVFGSVLALLLPVAGIVALDLSKARINSAADVSKRLKIPVIGAVPLIPAAIMRRLGEATQRNRIWKMRFTESVDGVAARLLRKADCDQTRVVLITSAMGGEGKTTLATQLAMSLARAQRKTVLVDFDLRRPTLDGALGLPLGPGICEALRGQGDIVDMVRESETEGLFVVTAGSWNRQVLADLSSGAVGSVLEQLRANFEFVIIDSSPLLPSVDTRLVCQHVDAVVLAVLRDVSQGPKVLAAQEMLDAFGVASVEAVVIGGEEHANAKNLAYQAAMLDEQVVLTEDEEDVA